MVTFFKGRLPLGACAKKPVWDRARLLQLFSALNLARLFLGAESRSPWPRVEGVQDEPRAAASASTTSTSAAPDSFSACTQA